MQFQLDFGMTVLFMATAIPFCFWGIPSQEVLEPLGWRKNVLFGC
jgi:hypothetical protein